MKAAGRSGSRISAFSPLPCHCSTRSGGNLTQTLEILSDIVRKRRAMRLKAKASTGEIRMTAYTLGVHCLFSRLARCLSPTRAILFRYGRTHGAISSLGRLGVCFYSHSFPCG